MGVDNDIPRELSDSITQLLGPTTNISLIKFMKAEWKNTVEKKILVLTDHRLVICANKVPSKVEFSLHFLELQGIESTDIKLGLKYEGKKLVVFAISDPSEINEIVFQISDALIQIFPHMTLQKLTGPLDISPPSRMKEVTDKLKSKTLLREASPCGNFSAQYRCMCDLHNLPYLDEVAWDVDTIYLSQNCKMLLLSDFDHLDAKHLVPVISALRHNTWFTTLCSCNVRLTPEAMNEFALVLKTNTTIECVCTVNSFGKSDFVQKIASAISSNISETAVKHFDFKGNPIDDKGAGYLCPVISNLTKGLEHLELSKCRLTHQGVNRLTSALCNNSVHEDTLTYLNLSGNNLKEDITNFHNFLAQPNALTQLNLSGTECALDSIFGALCRGCSLNLEHLNLSNNVFTNKKVRGSEVMVPVSWKQYFSSAVALRSISVANTKLPLEAVKNLLLGINSNEHLKDVRVDLRNTDLREDGALLLETCLGENKNITELDISDNGFDQHTVKIVRALGSNNHLKKLAIGKNFSNLKPKYIPDVIEVIVDLISAENSTIEGLSLADSKLKDAIMVLINALGGNSSLTVLDISGNGMGDYGARMLSKALHINNKLQVLHLDNNNISPQGYKDIAWAMKRNFCLRTIPSPMNDLTAAQAKDLKKTHKAWHQIEEALLRNNSPRRYGSEQAYRLQQGFLLSTSQQAIDRYIVQLLDTIEDLEKGETSIAVMNEIGLARGLMKDAENCRQLLIQLQKIGQKCEESGNVVEKKLKLMAGELQDCLESQLKSTLTSMLTCVQGKSLAVMEDEQFEQKVEEGSEERVTVPKSFCSTVLLEQVATEIYNKTSEVNVSVASYISEELIEGLLQALDKCSKTLISYKSNESELDKRARESIFRSKHKSQDTVSKAPPPTDYRKSVKVGKLRPVSIVSPLSPSDLKLSEDEEESSEEEEKAELTDTTDTTSVDSLLEESSTKPERKPEEANKLGKDESQKVKPELSSEEVDKSGKDKSPKVQPKIASAEYKKSGKDKSPKVKPEPSSKEVNKSRKDKSSKVKQEQGSNKKPVKKSEVKVGAFDDLAPASESATLVHITKTRPQPKRNVLTRPTQRKDTEDVSEGMLDFYEQKKVVKEHVVPTVSAPTKPKVKETSTAEDKPEPEMPVKQPKTRLPGKFGRLFGKSSKPQENDTSPPNKSSVSNTSTPDVSTEASPVESGRGGKTPDSPMKVQTPQKLPAQEAPVEREKTPEKEVEEEPENGKDETEEEEKPKEEPVKLEKRLPPGAVGMKGLGGMNLMAEIQRKRVSMVPPKPPPPNKSDRSPSDTSSKPELRERKLKPVTETPTQTATPGDPGPVPKKPMAPTRPPSLLNPKLSSDAAVINRSPNRSLSSSNTEEKKKEETMPESKSQPAERQAPQPPRRPNRPSRPEIPPNRANTVPATKPPDENESETNAQRKSKSLRGSSSGPPSALANSGTNGELPGNNNNTLVTTPSKNSKPVVPARPLSKVSESPNVGESSKPPDEDKRASNASTGSTQEQDSKQSSKEVEVFL